MVTVVVAGIVERDGRILLAQRPEGKSHGLLWEFPGGKVEEGETPEAALVRELQEELDLTVSVGKVFTRRSIVSPQGTLIVDYYRAVPVSGEARPLECRAVAWVRPEGAVRFDLSPLDAEVARDYLACGPGDSPGPAGK